MASIPNSRDDDKLYLAAVWSTVFIAILGFIFSYITLLQVAASFDMNWLQVRIFPLLLDLFMVVAHLAYFYLSKIHADVKWAASAMYMTVALSVAFNLSHVWAWQGLQTDWLMLAAWGLPPVILLLSVKTITVMVRTHQPDANLTKTPANLTETLRAPTDERPLNEAVKNPAAVATNEAPYTCKYCYEPQKSQNALNVHEGRYCTARPVEPTEAATNGKT